MRSKVLSFVMLAGVVLVAAGCIPPKSPPITTTTTTTVVDPPIDWAESPISFNHHTDPVGTRHSYTCPPGGEPHPVWGTARYTGDSSICTAAVHAGLITFADGGDVTYEMLEGDDSYTGSTQHGVTSIDWDSYFSTFAFVTPI